MKRLHIVAGVAGIVILGLALAACKRSTESTASGPAVADVPLSQIGLTKDGWFQVYDQAVAKAKETGKPILVDFTGSDWCVWCIKLDNEVFAHDAFKQWANEKVVLLKLDFPQRTELPRSLKRQNDELLKKHQVRGFPTILFLDANGNRIGKFGYAAGGPEAWTKKADEILAGL